MSKETRSAMAKKWIGGAINPAHRGMLHKELGIPAGKKIPAGKLAAAAKGDTAMARRARLAETLRGFKH